MIIQSEPIKGVTTLIFRNPEELDTTIRHLEELRLHKQMENTAYPACYSMYPEGINPKEIKTLAENAKRLYA